MLLAFCIGVVQTKQIAIDKEKPLDSVSTKGPLYPNEGKRMSSKKGDRREPIVTQQTLLFSRVEPAIAEKADAQGIPKEIGETYPDAPSATQANSTNEAAQTFLTATLPAKPGKKHNAKVSKARTRRRSTSPGQPALKETFNEGNAHGLPGRSAEVREVGTSAIAGWTVAEVRKGLGQMRKRWRARSECNPFCFSQPLLKGMTVEQFATAFLQGQHLKRCNKGKKR
jgi:hypothetical protein